MPDFTPIGHPKSLARKQIPTILGLLILIVALGVGLVFASKGLGVFAPRATPQTTPKDIKVSNLSDTSFTVSFLTDESTSGFLKYGTTATALNTQAGDDRDQLSGSVGQYTLHHITVRGLTAGTNYFYVLGTGSNSQFDNQGAPFSVKTGPTITSNTVTKTIYGNVVNATGGPAEGSIVYVQSPDSGQLSSLVKSSGSWAIPLNLARIPDGSQLATMTDDTTLTIVVQGVSENLTTSTQATVANAQPVVTLSLGGTNGATTAPTDTNAASDSAALTSQVSPAPSLSPLSSPLPVSNSDLNKLSLTSGSASNSGLLTDNTSNSASSSATTVVNLTKKTAQTVITSQPIITGIAAPNVVVTIQIHSTTAINQQTTADSNGDFSVDVASLGKNLEPGQHTVTYSYFDPTTNQTVTKTQTFTVAAAADTTNNSTTNLDVADQQLALANVTNTSPLTGGTTATTTDTTNAANGPFSSGNPFPIVSPNPNLSPSPSPIATTSGKVASQSGRTSQPSSGSGIPVSGSTGSTIALIVGGIAFILAGGWSYWVAQRVSVAHDELDD